MLMNNQKCKIYCKTIEKGRQAYYLHTNMCEYYLFTQNFRRSNKAFFGCGILLDNALDYSLNNSPSVRKTMTKLIPAIGYIEKEFGLILLRKTYREKVFNKRMLPYNRNKYNAKQYDIA